jgi:hypothetical protein
MINKLSLSNTPKLTGIFSPPPMLEDENKTKTKANAVLPGLSLKKSGIRPNSAIVLYGSRNKQQLFTYSVSTACLL